MDKESVMESTGKAAALSGFGTLFRRAWEIYRARFNIFSLIFMLYLLPILLISTLGFSVAKMLPHPLNPFVIAWIAAGALMGVLISMWGQVAFVYAVSGTEGIKEIAKTASEKLFRFVWVYILFGVATVAGLVLFIIPGVVAMVWFSFSFFVLARGNARGLNALIESRRHVKGLWWEVFARLFAVWSISFLLSFVPFVGSALSIFFMPYMMIFTFLIYEDLKKIKGELPAPTAAERKKWILVFLVGLTIASAVAVHTFKGFDFKTLSKLRGEPAKILNSTLPGSI